MKPADILASFVSLGSWPMRRWLAAILSAIAFSLVVAIPTDLLDTPFFSREVPPAWWAWPSLIVFSLLAGLLVASYVARPAGIASATRLDDSAETSMDAPARGGWIGGVLTFFAVGCPVCNKLVLLTLGSAGAMRWFEPVQPVLQLGAVVLLLWALHRRLQGENQCPVSPRTHTTAGENRG